MTKMVDPKRFPNFTRAQRKPGPFAKLKSVGGKTGIRVRRKISGFTKSLVIGSAFTFLGVFFADKISIEPYYPYCSFAHSAGVAPLKRSDPGYRPQLDADGDGIACETTP